ncbi:beta-ketoacyl synthase N-terminal-like domain-containing protein [Streptomyces stramineus]
MANAGAAMLSLLYGITGPGLCFSTACASGGHAVGKAHSSSGPEPRTWCWPAPTKRA